MYIILNTMIVYTHGFAYRVVWEFIPVDLPSKKAPDPTTVYIHVWSLYNIIIILILFRMMTRLTELWLTRDEDTTVKGSQVESAVLRMARLYASNVADIVQGV